MASYRKLKSGWKVTISQRDENGKLRQTSKQGFATKLEARRYAATIEQDIDGVKKAKQDILFLDYYDQWVDTYKRPKVQAGTLQSFKSVRNLIEKFKMSLALIISSFSTKSVKNMQKAPCIRLQKLLKAVSNQPL